MIADLSWKDTYGYYGLRVDPTFDDLVKTYNVKPQKIRVPKNREAKWYALGPYRAYLLELSKKYNDYEHLKLKIRQAGSTTSPGNMMFTDASGMSLDPSRKIGRAHV